MGKLITSIFGNWTKAWGAGIGTSIGEALVRLIEGQFGDVLTATGEAAIVVFVAGLVTWFFPANTPKTA